MIKIKNPWRWVMWPLAIYMAVLLLLVLAENSLVYPAPKYPRGDWRPSFAHQDIYFESLDKTALHGWFIEHPQPRACLLFCHGNGEHVAAAGPELAFLSDRLGVSVFVFDYRGYGRSHGSPHERGILEDGRAAFDWLSRSPNVDPSKIIVLGRSLGGGVAVDIAQARRPAALVLQSTFTRLPDAAARFYPWVPVNWLMRNRYNSVEKIASYQGPLLQIHGDCDEIVAFDLGQSLHAACGSSQKSFVTVAGAGHNDLQLRDYLAELDAFVDLVATEKVARDE